MNKNPVDFYRHCAAWAFDAGYQGRIDFLRNLNPGGIDKQWFFEEYVHVVLASGFKWAIVEQYKPLLSRAFREWNVDEISQAPETVYSRAMSIFGHTGKIRAIVETAVRLSNWTPQEYENFIDLVATLDNARVLRMLRTFPFIGPITQYHLARNIGLNFAKPDRHLIKAAARCGFPPTADGVFQFVEEIKNATRERIGVIDFVVWAYMESHPDCG